MDEIKKELEKVRASIKSLLALGNDISDEQAEKLDSYNKQAVKLQARIDAISQAEKAEADEKERFEREKKEAVEAAVKAERAKNNRLPFEGSAPYQSQYSDTWKYDGLDAGETSLLIETLQSAGKNVSGGAVKALSLKIAELKDDNTEEGRKGISYVKNAFKAATRIDPTPDAVSAAVKAATDPMYSGGSGIGSDWVGTAYSNQIWAAIRAANVVFDKIPSQVVPDGYSSVYVPLESTDPTWYGVSEATASDSTLKVPAATVTASQMATSNKQLTLSKLGARVLYTNEMTEDSLIPFVSQLRQQLTTSGAEILEHLMIDGDVETSANKNINSIDGTPAAGTVYLLQDGFRKLALVTNTANSRSASGSFVIEDYIETLKLMGTAGLNGADPRNVSFLVDMPTYWANMKLPEVKTRDVNSAATVENGFLTRAYGYSILPAYQMHRNSSVRLANTAGKVATGTVANNTTGAILAVRFDQWKQAFKRRMTIETTRIANADSWEIVALARWGMTYRDTEASAISYNVGV